MSESPLSVLILDDDFRVARLHAEIVGSAPGFRVAAVCPTVAEARRAAAAGGVDLALLDVYLPDGSGLALMRALDVDCFVLSAAGEADGVRRALRYGALAVLVKPFPASLLIERLDGYRRYRRLLQRTEVLGQAQVDQAVRMLRGGASRPSPAASPTEQAVTRAVLSADEPLSAVEVAERVGISRATAQRYLAQLCDAGRLEVHLRYGSAGRPEHRFVAPGGSGGVGG